MAFGLLAGLNVSLYYGVPDNVKKYRQISAVSRCGVSFTRPLSVRETFRTVPFRLLSNYKPCLVSSSLCATFTFSSIMQCCGAETFCFGSSSDFQKVPWLRR
jgi:hypothetical protein